MNMCLKCLEVFDKKMDISISPVTHHEELEGIDNLMLPVIVKLTQMGYRTKSCCQGSFADLNSLNELYIAFEHDSILNLIKHNPETPKGWFYCEDTLRPKEYDGVVSPGTFELTPTGLINRYRTNYIMIHRLMYSLLDWVKKLK